MRLFSWIRILSKTRVELNYDENNETYNFCLRGALINLLVSCFEHPKKYSVCKLFNFVIHGIRNDEL